MTELGTHWITCRRSTAASARARQALSGTGICVLAHIFSCAGQLPSTQLPGDNVATEEQAPVDVAETGEAQPLFSASRWRAEGGETWMQAAFSDNDHALVFSKASEQWELLDFSGEKLQILNGLSRSDAYHLHFDLDPEQQRVLVVDGDLRLLQWPTGEAVLLLSDGWMGAAMARDAPHFAVLHQEEDAQTKRPLRSLELRSTVDGELLNRWTISRHAEEEQFDLETYDFGLYFTPRLLIYYENRGWSASCGGGDEWVELRVFELSTGEELLGWRQAFPRTSPDQNSVLLRVMSGWVFRTSWDQDSGRLAIQTHDQLLTWSTEEYSRSPETYVPVLQDARLPESVDLPLALQELQRRSSPVLSSLLEQGAAQTLSCLMEHAELHSAAFSPDGSRLLLVYDTHYELWSTAERLARGCTRNEE